MRKFTTAIMVLFTISLFSQTTTIEGYIYESGNRGYMSDVSVTAEDMETDKILGKSISDKDGFFQISLPVNTKVRLYAAKDMFDIKRLETEVGEGKSFVKFEMGRAPGYTFEVTLAEKKSTPDAIVDAIKGTRIEVYNNTTRKSIMDLKDHDSPAFQLNLEKGNHYTLLIRKNGFLSKRMEAKVDVEGCILCFEGVGNVGPGVSDNLTENNAFGVLLANVELERIFEGKTMEIQNLYYDLNKWALSGSAKKELIKVITLMKDNPNLTLELGSHTDSRGNSEQNLSLSIKRAKSAANYLLENGGITKSRIVYKGYGENILLNECADGVKCDEAQHAINRRTELKIVGITDMKEVKSLAQMKKEAQLEAEILSLMDQEQVQAKDEDELKKILQDKEIKKTDPVILSLVEIEGDNISKIDSFILSEATEEAIKKADVATLSEAEREAKGEGDIKTKTDVATLSEAKGEGDIKTKTDVATLSEAKGEGDIKTKTDVATLSEAEREAGNKAPQPFPPVSDGIKVVLMQSETLLEKDHFIFLRHRDIEIYDNKKGRFYYMIGGFTNESEAFRFLDSYIAPDKKYKESFIAKFTDGKIAIVR